MSEKYLSIEEMVSLPQFQDTAVSDDGQRVAFVKQTTDWDEDAYVKHVWVYERESGKSFPLTAGKQQSTQPRFSPDSQTVAYISKEDEDDKQKKQIFIQRRGEMNAVQISHASKDVESFKWSPDGNGIFFIAKRPETEEMKKRKEMYGDFTCVDRDFTYNSLYYLAIESNKKQTDLFSLPKDLRNDKDEKEDTPALSLTDSMNIHVQHYDISPDGKRVVFNATPTPKIVDYFDQNIYLLEIDTKEITKLDCSTLNGGTVLFSPDGSKLCYNRFVKEKAMFNNMTLEIYDLESQKTSQPVIDIDENVIPVRWVEAGMLITWQERTNYLAGLVTENGDMTPLVDQTDMVATRPSITSDAKTFVCIKATSQKAEEVYVNGQRITDQYKYYDEIKLSKKEIIQWETNDGLEIEGILSVPTDYDAAKSYPLLVAVHGGPAGTSIATPTTNLYQPIESFVEKGFLVLEPNYRGSTGYGEAFRKANYRKLGVGDYEDVISGVDYLIQTKGIDREKVGILGWSQGGYISAFCATYSDRFQAISVGAGISNWMTYYVNTDITNFTRSYLGDTPWNDEEIYRKTSPMTYINQACTPTLIQHGEKDSRVPVPNAFELYRGLKDVGVQAELVIYKGMEHGSNKPGLSRAILSQNLNWFSHHILDEPLDEDRK
ncbi:S9 family peptidase [Virgibacillus flavescens]|uniref:S9 family peptidase n=1 Tax=Virgibacillus flavescens TaxID=1611422 RepID=UPI003D356A6A